MKVGVWLSEDMVPTKGGGASYFKSLINGIDKYIFDKNIEVEFVSYKYKKSHSYFNKKVTS